MEDKASPVMGWEEWMEMRMANGPIAAMRSLRNGTGGQGIHVVYLDHRDAQKHSNFHEAFSILI